MTSTSPILFDDMVEIQLQQGNISVVRQELESIRSAQLRTPLSDAAGQKKMEDQYSAKKSELQTEERNLRQFMKDARARYDTFRASQPNEEKSIVPLGVSAPTITNDVKVADPDKFSGNIDAYQLWSNKLEIDSTIRAAEASFSGGTTVSKPGLTARTLPFKNLSTLKVWDDASRPFLASVTPIIRPSPSLIAQSTATANKESTPTIHEQVQRPRSHDGAVPDIEHFAEEEIPRSPTTPLVSLSSQRQPETSGESKTGLVVAAVGLALTAGSTSDQEHETASTSGASNNGWSIVEDVAESPTDEVYDDAVAV
ncbi:hypothetical protein SeLEV6574_g08591 [Synchytrium endobioticum]|uniref:Uncharacterized protein n=1 Tax=Synchytrium endobioticum TaxID=286115 RepID=A0A507BUQ4_9FUNG|nr:hypothetical protein SeLEV6574_g08591 [Synchytrium endobioticum]